MKLVAFAIAQADDDDDDAHDDAHDDDDDDDDDDDAPPEDDDDAADAALRGTAGGTRARVRGDHEDGLLFGRQESETGGNRRRRRRRRRPRPRQPIDRSGGERLPTFNSFPIRFHRDLSFHH